MAIRFVLAREKAADIFAELGSGAVLDLYLTAPRLERFGGVSFSRPKLPARSMVLKPVDLGEAPLDYNNALGQLAREQKYDRVYLITDLPAARSQRGGPRCDGRTAAGQFRDYFLWRASWVARGRALENQRRNSQLFIQRRRALKITLRGGGAPLATRDLAIAAGGYASASFEGLPLHAFFEAEIDSRDALDLDNRSFAVASTTENPANSGNIAAATGT